MNEATPNSTEGFELRCGEYEKYTLARFLFLSGASALAALGMAANAFLVYFFITRKPRNSFPTLYPGVLAMLDWCMCFMYIAIFGADAAVFYLSDHSLFLIYHMYIVPAFVVARITQLAIPYMLIFATLERLVWISGGIRNPLLKAMYSDRGRYVTVIVSLLLCVALRLPVAWAIVVYEFPNCEFFLRSKMAHIAEWARESYAYHIYDFHFLVIAQTFVPFVVLLVLNFMVVHRLAKVEHSSRLDTARPSACSAQISASAPPLLGSKELQLTYTFERNGSVNLTDTHSFISERSSVRHRTNNSAVRAAIYTMFGIVTSYLLSNSLHLVLTILERSDSNLLRDPTDPALASTFHTAFSDTVSFVYMFTSAIRIAIYIGCNPTIRRDVGQMAADFWRRIRGTDSPQKPAPCALLIPNHAPTML